MSFRAHTHNVVENLVMRRGKTNLSDILVSHSADLLNIGRTLRNVLDGVTLEDELILLVLGRLNIDTLLHDNSSDDLLADEVSDLDLGEASLGVGGHVDVDGEMGVDVSHLVLEALGHTDHQVVDVSSDGSEGSDILSVAVVDLNRDDVLLGLTKVHGQVAKVLDQLSCFRRVRYFVARSYRTGEMLGIKKFVPRGPSTVTIRDLMATLTIRTNESAFHIPIAFRKAQWPQSPVPSRGEASVRCKPPCRRRANILLFSSKSIGRATTGKRCNVPPSGISKSSWE